MILILGRFIFYKWLTMSTDIGYMAGSKLSTNKKKKYNRICPQLSFDQNFTLTNYK